MKTKLGKRSLLLLLVLVLLPLFPLAEETEEDRWLFLYRVPGTEIKLMLPVTMLFDTVHYDPIRIRFWMYDTAAPDVSYLFVAERFAESGDVLLEDFSDGYYPLLASWLLGLTEEAEITYLEDFAAERSALHVRDPELDDDLQYITTQDDWVYALVVRPDNGELTEVQEEELRYLMASSMEADQRTLETSVRLPLATKATQLPAYTGLQVEYDDAGYYYAMLSDVYEGSVLCTFIGLQDISFIKHDSMETLPKTAQDLLFSYLGETQAPEKYDDLTDFTPTQSVRHYYTEGLANNNHYFIAMKNGWALVCMFMERDVPHDATRDLERSQQVFAAALSGKSRVSDWSQKRAQVPIPGGRLVFDLPEGWRLDDVDDDGESRYYVLGNTEDWRRGAWLRLPSTALEGTDTIESLDDILGSDLYETYRTKIIEDTGDLDPEILVLEAGMGGNPTVMIMDHNRTKGVQLGFINGTLIVSGPLTQEKPMFGEDMAALWEWMQWEPTGGL